MDKQGKKQGFFATMVMDDIKLNILYACKQLTATNSTTMATFFDETVQNLSKYISFCTNLNNFYNKMYLIRR